MFAIFLLAGLLNGALICFLIYRKMAKFDKIAVETTGKILKLTEKEESDSDNNKSIVQYAEVSFSSLLMPITVEKKISKKGYKIGGLIPVFYDSNKPDQAILEKRQNGKPFLIIGLIMALVAIGVFVYNFEEAILDYKQSPDFFNIGIGLFLLGMIGNFFVLKKGKLI
jgi:hypothetical protein